MTFLHLDFETASTADLSRTGAHVYAHHPDTQILCMGYAFDDRPACIWLPGQPFPIDVFRHVQDEGIVCAWNAEFEHYVWNIVLRRITFLPHMRWDQMHCTMARAAGWGLPLKLERAAIAVGSGYVKNKSGHGLMLRMSKPRSVIAGHAIWWHDTDPQKYLDLQQYCRDDVEAERGVDKLIPAMADQEREIWLIDRQMNDTGMRVDTLAVSMLDDMARQALRDLDRRMYLVTSGVVPTTASIAKLLAFVQSNGVLALNLTGDSIEQLLQQQLPDTVRDALLLRNLARKTSTKKLMAMADALGMHDRIRGMFQYAGAGRTMRWAGRLVQPQNLPRPVKGLDAVSAIEHISRGASADMVREFWGEPLDVVAACLRPCFIAAPQHVLASCDFSQIEARVVAWLAGQQNILGVFADPTKDVYEYTASQVGSSNRQLGKVLVLACGFGMGGIKFADTARKYDVHLDQVAATVNVATWRRNNYKIVALWYALEDAAKRAIRKPGSIFAAGDKDRITFRMGVNKLAGALLMQLPSGHIIAYRDAAIAMKDGREQITFMGVDQQTRQWTQQYTYGGKLVENATQSVARHIMAHAMRSMHRSGLTLVGTVHDEIIVEVETQHGEQTRDQMLRIMKSLPQWANGLPVNATGWFGPRYGKG